MKNLLLTGSNVLAFMADRKTCTRRIIPNVPAEVVCIRFPQPGLAVGYNRYQHPIWTGRPRFRPGEIVFIGEAWRTLARYNKFTPARLPKSIPVPILYLSDAHPMSPISGWGRYRQGRFLPERFARNFALITDVRAERLQEITEEEEVNEGLERQFLPDGSAGWGAGLVTARTSFGLLWESIHGPGSWDANPWVWRYGIKRKDKP